MSDDYGNDNYAQNCDNTDDCSSGGGLGLGVLGLASLGAWGAWGSPWSSSSSIFGSSTSQTSPTTPDSVVGPSSYAYQDSASAQKAPAKGPGKFKLFLRSYGTSFLVASVVAAAGLSVYVGVQNAAAMRHTAEQGAEFMAAREQVTKPKPLRGIKEMYVMAARTSYYNAKTYSEEGLLYCRNAVKVIGKVNKDGMLPIEDPTTPGKQSVIQVSAVTDTQRTMAQCGYEEAAKPAAKKTSSLSSSYGL